MANDDNTPEGDEEEDEELSLPAPNQYFQDEVDKHQADADTAAEVAADIVANTRYDSFFAPYQPALRTSFANHYVLHRQHWIADGEREDHRPARHLNLHEKEAYGALWAIQQKKLFDLQCRWRAEEVRDVPGVLITDDFQTLSLGIENCPAVPPITPEEFALFLAWATQADYAANFDDVLDQRFGWQQFRLVREALAPDAAPIAGRVIPTKKAVPDWYQFHNEHTGNGRLLHLPDVRGAKEERYWDAWRAGEDERKAIAEAAGAPAPDPRPSYLPGEELRALAQEFARRFEPPRLNRWREVSELLHPPQTDEQRKFNTILLRLQMIAEPVPVVAGADWREATRQAFRAHCHRKLLECLPLVYEEYAQRQAWGIAQPRRFDEDFDPLKYDLAGLYRGWILDGRTRLGEPEDFDF